MIECGWDYMELICWCTLAELTAFELQLLISLSIFKLKSSNASFLVRFHGLFISSSLSILYHCICADPYHKSCCNVIAVVRAKYHSWPSVDPSLTWHSASTELEMVMATVFDIPTVWLALTLSDRDVTQLSLCSACYWWSLCRSWVKKQAFSHPLQTLTVQKLVSSSSGFSSSIIIFLVGQRKKVDWTVEILRGDMISRWPDTWSSHG